ncbi:MAG: long-chain-acyl-CoA synthetase [Pseudomonadota bacterium]
MLSKLANYSRFYGRMKGIRKLMSEVDNNTTTLVADEIEATVDRHRDKTAFIFEGQTQSFGAFEARANQVADWALKQGFKPGDTIALNMENCPDFVAIWFGLSKVGVVTALINCNLEGAGLTHCIEIVDAKAVISSGGQARNVQAIADGLKNPVTLWDMDGAAGSNLAEALQGCSEERPDTSHREPLTHFETCVYIYTSGTTGLPKAARITNARFKRVFRLAVPLGDITADDIVYNSLPLYHITGGGLGIGATVFAGAAMHIRRKFSASGFWDDVSESGATVFMYIGEFCRYLLNSSKHPKERSHNLRAGMGNGLRADVWEQFVERFNVPSMRELYGSTEGNVNFLNFDGTVGAVGQAPRFMDPVMGTAFVKFDVEAEEPIRDSKGFCQKCGPGEVGEVLGKIADEGRATFDGYNDKKATEKKILTDVFKKGDRWFRTGDLMTRDELGYVRFVDRIGDTFRWKGENVATNEVADILAKFDGIELANVYGVEVPNAEGRAGMASLTVKDTIDFGALAKHLSDNLPSYAVPLFIRQTREADTTATFKFRKVDAVKEGFDPSKVADPVLMFDPQAVTYVPLTAETFDSILSGSVRL